MSVALFEIMRAANDRRNTVWAAALAFAARVDAADPMSEMPPLIHRLVSAGDVILARTSWSGGVAERVPPDQVMEALNEESQWHPRRLPWAKRLRLFATEAGKQKFESGMFGVPGPIARAIPSPDRYELQPVTCVEALGMSLAVAAYFAGSVVGYIVGNLGVPASLSNFSLGGIVGSVIGGVTCMGATMSVWRKFSPAVDAAELPENIVQDQFNQGPDLKEIDPFGDHRY